VFSPRLEQFSNGAIPDWRFSGISLKLLPISTHTALKPFETACRLTHNGNNTLGVFRGFAGGTQIWISVIFGPATSEAKLIPLFPEIPGGFPLAEPFGLTRVLAVGG